MWVEVGGDVSVKRLTATCIGCRVVPGSRDWKLGATRGGPHMVGGGGRGQLSALNGHRLGDGGGAFR